jgi:transposase
MFVSVIKDNKSKKEFVVIRESFRNINGSPTARNLENFGFFNTEEEKQALIKKANEKIEILKQEKEQKNSQLPVNFALQNSNANIDENLGYRILERIYEKFEFKDFFDKTINANKKEGAFDINEVVKLLVYSRILKPDSKFETFSCKQTFFGDIFRNVKLDNLYDTLDDLSDHNSEIQTHTNNKIKELYDRELTLVFYDATNYYFEIDRNDGYDEDGNPLGLRYEGACKEHKPTPIVQMGLLMDKYRVPIAYKVFPGNTHDQNTLIPTIENFQKTLGIQKITLVADKGLNSGKNLNYLIDNGHKFIVSQMVRTIDKKFREKILESDGYK